MAESKKVKLGLVQMSCTGQKHDNIQKAVAEICKAAAA